MKFLTPIYQTLMHAFKDRAFERFDSMKSFMEPISLMQEYGTLRLDAGRQSGKSKATASFAADWLDSGNDVIVITEGLSRSNELVSHIKKHPINNFSSNRGWIVPDTIRNFIACSNNFSKYRGRSLTRALIIIDEPMNTPDMRKFYNAYLKLINEYMCQGQKPLPLFFVIGIQ